MVLSRDAARKLFPYRRRNPTRNAAADLVAKRREGPLLPFVKVKIDATRSGPT